MSEILEGEVRFFRVDTISDQQVVDFEHDFAEFSDYVRMRFGHDEEEKITESQNMHALLRMFTNLYLESGVAKIDPMKPLESRQIIDDKRYKFTETVVDHFFGEEDSGGSTAELGEKEILRASAWYRSRLDEIVKGL